MDGNPFNNDDIRFQIPHFMYSATPLLAQGGGVEVISDASASSWLSINGFSARDEYKDDHHIESTHAPFDFEDFPPEPQFTIQHNPSVVPPNLSILLANSVIPPSSLGLPVYSASGFDLVSIFSRIATRPYPRIVLGPVDLTCSFVIVDVRRHDNPIVYCSASFCALTGYNEHEILGRNCRFLQSPDGNVQRGQPRLFTSPDAVAHLKKSLGADKECQTSIVNYRKDGSAFINLVTVIPITGGVSGLPNEETDIVYHVGFQVDLTEQPNAILEKLKDGSYIVNYANPVAITSNNRISSSYLRPQKPNVIPPTIISKHLKRLLVDRSFLRSLPITTATTVPLPLSSSSSSSSFDAFDSSSLPSAATQLLHLILLEASPDFIHVVSLKGSFLYVAPSVRRVLGYGSEEMVGKSIADFTHPADVVPLMRELKESSATGAAATDGAGHPRTVDLLFRARTKSGVYVWVECRGRLHVEPGKGRKAIILSGRARDMPRLSWATLARSGGMASKGEFWGMLTPRGTPSFLVVGSAVAGVLGWTSADLVGRTLRSVLADEGGVARVEDEVRWATEAQRSIRCLMRTKAGAFKKVLLVLHRSEGVVSGGSIAHPPIVYCVREVDSSISPLALISSSSLSGAIPPLTPRVKAQVLEHPLDSDVFEELDTSRGSSWQYEMQQLRFANQRLMDEIAALEDQQKASRAEGLTKPQETEHQQPQRHDQRHDQRQDHFQNQFQDHRVLSVQPRVQQHQMFPPQQQQLQSSIPLSFTRPLHNIHHQHYIAPVPRPVLPIPSTTPLQKSWRNDWASMPSQAPPQHAAFASYSNPTAFELPCAAFEPSPAAAFAPSPSTAFSASPPTVAYSASPTTPVFTSHFNSDPSFGHSFANQQLYHHHQSYHQNQLPPSLKRSWRAMDNRTS